MTTPTREQECKHEHIKTWVFEDTKEPAMWSCAYCGLRFAPEMATLTAGRDQGLREAMEVCEREAEGFGGIAAGPFATDFGKHTHNAMAAGAKNCPAAIEQLRK